MTYRNLLESMPSAGDLIDLVNPVVSIDEFQPKAGHEFKYITIAFSVVEESAAEDLRTFLERGRAEVIDIEVSPNPDPDGNWLVFVEVKRNECFWNTLEFLLKETERLLGHKEDWVFTTYFSTDPLPMNMAKDAVKTKPSEYAISRVKKHKKANEGKRTMKDSVLGFLSESMISDVRFNGRVIEVKSSKDWIAFKMNACGLENRLMERISTAPFVMTNVPSEVRKLEHALGNKYSVYSHDNMVYVRNNVQNRLLILDRYV
jgi:hypothetical protein